MEGPDAAPLLVIDKIGKGRVAMLMSDQAWLWSKGFDGGGPYSEMFRRSAHWLMGEPDLDAEKLSATSENGVLAIERRTLEDKAQSVVVEKPDGTKETVSLSKTANGIYRGSVKSAGQGAYRLSSGDVSTVTAIGALNPKEYAQLQPTTQLLTPLAEGTGGGLFATALSGDVPAIRRVKAGKTLKGDNWMGLIAHEDYAVTASKRSAKAFKSADKDGSTTLSLFELEDWREAALGSLDAAPGTLAFDKDFDQRVTRDEFDHAMTFVFKTGDKNEDGVLELNDLVKVFEMPRRPVIEEDNTIERINRQDREQRRRGY